MTVPPGPTDIGVVTGPANAAAITLLPDRAGVPVAEADQLHGYALNQVTVVFERDATVAEMNAFARAAGSTAIATSQKGEPVVSFFVPRQADGEALQVLIDRLSAEPGVVTVVPSLMGTTSMLPDIEPGRPVNSSELRHLLATRFPAAWNAIGRDCTSPITMIVWDELGPQRLRPGVETQLDIDFSKTSTNPGNRSVKGHGYDVALIAAGKFDSRAPTGAAGFDGCVRILPVDVVGRTLHGQLVQLALELIALTDTRFILSSSLGAVAPSCAGGGACDESTAATVSVRARAASVESLFVHGAKFAKLASLANLSSRALISVAAGNHAPGTAGFLARNYPWYRSGLFATMPSIATQVDRVDAILTDASLWRADSANLPSIEFTADQRTRIANAVRTITTTALPRDSLIITGSAEVTETPAAAVKSSFSFDDYDVLAVGSGVVGINGAVIEGTSFAQPQIAGLAALLWNAIPSRSASPQVIRALIADNALPIPDGALTDAYAATLALPRLDPTLRIRLALVDIDESGALDRSDIERFREAFDASTGVRDYSRFDLNGDGFTSKDATAVFDLDGDGAISGDRENAATDRDVLCAIAQKDPTITLDLQASVALEPLCGCAQGQTQEWPGLGTMVCVPAGTFLMGCLDGRDDLFAECQPGSDRVREVTITQSFWMMEAELSAAFWALATGDDVGRCASGTDSSLCPAVDISWYNAVAFADALSTQLGLPACGERGAPSCRGFRLPTEAEFEYAARGGENFVYPGSNSASLVAHTPGSSATLGRSCALQPNGFGLCDMSGNVREWVWDNIPMPGVSLGDLVSEDLAQEDFIAPYDGPDVVSDPVNHSVSTTIEGIEIHATRGGDPTYAMRCSDRLPGLSRGPANQSGTEVSDGAVGFRLVRIARRLP